MPSPISQQIKERILQLAPIMAQNEIAKKLKVQPATVSQYINQEKDRVKDLQSNLKAEHLELDTDIAFELSSLTRYSPDKEKAEYDLLDEFADAFGITLKPVNESLENKSEFLDFLRSKAYELN